MVAEIVGRGMQQQQQQQQQQASTSIARLIVELASADRGLTLCSIEEDELEQQARSERIRTLNTGQLTLFILHCEKILPTLHNVDIISSYEAMLKVAREEKERRDEEIASAEAELVAKLKQKHAGAKAKAWDKTHAGLDVQLAEFQKFMKVRAKRKAAAEAKALDLQRQNADRMEIPELMERVRMHRIRLAVAGICICAAGAIVFAIPWPLQWIALAGALCLWLCGIACILTALIRQPRFEIVPANEKDMRRRVRKLQAQYLKEYEEEVKNNYDEFEAAFQRELQLRKEIIAKLRAQEQGGQKGAAAADGDVNGSETDTVSTLASVSVPPSEHESPSGG